MIVNSKFISVSHIFIASSGVKISYIHCRTKGMFNSRLCMKNLKVITIITIFLVTMSAVNLLAQGRQTSGARAAYGYPSDYNYKAKKKKKSKKKKQRKTVISKGKAKQPLYRKKNPWAN